MVLEQKSDVLGVLSSSLCLVHCLFTPILFVVQSSCCTAATPLWWKSIDYIFLFISFFAVYKSANETSKTWMKYALFFSWTLLCFIIINERLALINIPEESIYVASLLMVSLHIYNSKFCQCANDTCCSSEKLKNN